MAVQRLVSATPPPGPGAGAVPARMTPLDTSIFNQVVGGSMDSVRQEVDDAFADMGTFHNQDPDTAMRMAGGHSARLSFIRVKVMRIEDFNREWKNVRVRELEPAIAELANQYQIASRLHSVRELDWKMEAGER